MGIIIQVVVRIRDFTLSGNSRQGGGFWEGGWAYIRVDWTWSHVFKECTRGFEEERWVGESLGEGTRASWRLKNWRQRDLHFEQWLGKQEKGHGGFSPNGMQSWLSTQAVRSHYCLAVWCGGRGIVEQDRRSFSLGLQVLAAVGSS